MKEKIEKVKHTKCETRTHYYKKEEV